MNKFASFILKQARLTHLINKLASFILSLLATQKQQRVCKSCLFITSFVVRVWVRVLIVVALRRRGRHSHCRASGGRCWWTRRPWPCGRGAVLALTASVAVLLFVFEPERLWNCACVSLVISTHWKTNSWYYSHIKYAVMRRRFHLILAYVSFTDICLYDDWFTFMCVCMYI